jgi:hypothetical protein
MYQKCLGREFARNESLRCPHSKHCLTRVSGSLSLGRAWFALVGTGIRDKCLCWTNRLASKSREDSRRIAPKPKPSGSLCCATPVRVERKLTETEMVSPVTSEILTEVGRPLSCHCTSFPFPGPRCSTQDVETGAAGRNTCQHKNPVLVTRMRRLQCRRIRWI